MFIRVTSINECTDIYVDEDRDVHGHKALALGQTRRQFGVIQVLFWPKNSHSNFMLVTAISNSIMVAFYKFVVDKCHYFCNVFQHTLHLLQNLRGPTLHLYVDSAATCVAENDYWDLFIVTWYSARTNVFVDFAGTNSILTYTFYYSI